MLAELSNSVVPIFSGGSTLLIGILVLVYGRDRVRAKMFALFSLILSTWLLGSAYMQIYCLDEPYAIFIDRLIYLAVATIPVVVFHFSTKFVRLRYTKHLLLFGYGMMACFWILIWFPFFLSGLYQFDNGCHTQAGPLHFPFLVYFIGYSILALVNVFVAYKEENTAKDKKNLQFIFIGLLAQAMVGTSAFLPAYNINSLTFSYFSGGITSFILLYAMFRHNLLELRIVAMRIFITFVSAISLLQIFLVDTRVLQIINTFVFVLIVVLGFLVTRNVQEEITNREKGEKLARYLANANARLRQLDRQKTEFVSVASHQLRSPIAAIKGYTSLIIDGSFGKVPKELDEPLSTIMESSKRIAIMVDDFLNVTRIEQGRMTYNMKPLNLHDIVFSVYEELSIIAEKKGLKLEVECDSQVTAQVMADEGKLRQVFANIIDNAIKYTEKGFVKVSAQVMQNHKVVLVKIEDSGIGVAPEEQGELFHKFNRATNANESSVYGTGLGLYIAKEIIKAHNGWIHVSSAGVGKGSVFTIELPLATHSINTKKTELKIEDADIEKEKPAEKEVVKKTKK